MPEEQKGVVIPEEVLKNFGEQLKAVQEKLKNGYDAKELEPIVAEIVRDQLKVQSKATPVQKGGEMPLELKGLSANQIHQLESKHPLVLELQEKADNVFLLAKYLRMDPRNLKSYEELQQFLVKTGTTAIAAGAANQGAEWIPTGFSAQLYQKVRLELKVAALFPEITMPMNPFKPPVLLGDSTAFYVPESTADEQLIPASIPPTIPTTGAVTLTAKKIAARMRISDEANEDSLVPMLDTMKNNIVLAIAQAIENCTINGDTSGTHQDSDVTNAKDARKAWDGLRRVNAQTSPAAKVDISTFNEAAMRSIRKKMGVYGVDPNKIAHIVGISDYIQLLGFTGLLTMEKYGPNATILTGELAKFDGAPVIVSEYIRENLNASGVYDGSTTTKTILLTVRRDAFLRGNRKGMTLVMGTDIENQQQVLVAHVRQAFSNIYAVTAGVVGMGYNLTT